MRKRNNKKKTMIIIVIILFILALIATYIILVTKGVFNNILLDTRDLVCERVTDGEAIDEKKQYIFKFDKKSYLIEYNETTYLTFLKLEFAKEYYETSNAYIQNLELVENDNTVKFSFSHKNIKEDGLLSGKTKQEVKQLYIEKYYYNCK